MNRPRRDCSTPLLLTRSVYIQRSIKEGLAVGRKERGGVSSAALVSGNILLLRCYFTAPLRRIPFYSACTLRPLRWIAEVVGTYGTVRSTWSTKRRRDFQSTLCVCLSTPKHQTIGGEGPGWDTQDWLHTITCSPLRLLLLGMMTLCTEYLTLLLIYMWCASHASPWFCARTSGKSDISLWTLGLSEWMILPHCFVRVPQPLRRACPHSHPIN
jgi:hypothetical protein